MKKYIRIIIPVMIFVAVAAFILFLPDGSFDGGCKKGNHTYTVDNVCSRCGDVWEYTEGLYFTKFENGVAACGFLNEEDAKVTDIVIPYGYEGKPVVAIDTKNYYPYPENGTWGENTKSIVIPESVENILQDAFKNCANLKTVTMSGNLKLIEKDAFFGTAIYNDKNNWVDGVLYIDNYLIEANKNVAEDYTIKDGTRVIAMSAFSGTDLKQIVIPDSVRSICSWAFQDCEMLESVEILAETINLDMEAFVSCGALKSVTLPSGLQEIGFACFANCTSLENIQIPKSVEVILGDAFHGCTALKDIEILGMPKNVGQFAFDNTAYYNTESNWQGDSLIIGACLIVVKKSAIGAYTVPDGVFTIADYALEGCEKLTEITVPSGVKYIGRFAFCECITVEKITLSEGIISFARGAFSDCRSIEEIVLPNSVTGVDSDLFRNCVKLKKVTLPDGIKTLPSSMFGYCSSLESIVIPDTVTELGRSVFSKCTSLKSITIPDSVTKMWDYVFGGCSSLESITIPASVIYIGNGCFINCENLTDAVFADTQGWMIENEAIPSDALGDMKKAAEYLLKTYNAQTWTKND